LPSLACEPLRCAPVFEVTGLQIVGLTKERRVASAVEKEFDTGLTRAEWLLLLVLAAVQFTNTMDFMIMMPLGPHCREELGIDPQQFALVVAAYGFCAALTGLVAAWFIDRFDRRSSLLVLYAGLI